MEKVKVAPRDAVVPKFPALIGTSAQGRPNFIAVATLGWVCFDMIAVSLGRRQFSTRCLRGTLEFSVNFPAADQLDRFDFCGVNSGLEVDKSALFETFTGELEHAPMIADFPVTFACRVAQVLEKPQHAVFLGEIVDAYVSEECMTGGIADITKTSPVIFSRVPGEGKSGTYRSLGPEIGRPWTVGRAIESVRLSRSGMSEDKSE